MEKRVKHLFVVISLLVINFLIIQHAIAAPTKLSHINGGKLKSPAKIALDNEGKIYVTDTSGNRLIIYNRNGAFLKEIRGLENPLGIAVDASGRIYIGAGWDWEGTPMAYVSVYNPDLSFSHKLGSGDGEFVKPAAIVIDSSGDIYVVDSKSDVVKVYSSSGDFKFSFGATGSGNGQFNSPTDIAIDDVRGEVIVSDLQIIRTMNGPTGGARVQVFDKAGIFKRAFGSYGIEAGKLISPLGLSVDLSGNIYVADSYLWVVQIFDSAGNPAGVLFDPTAPMGTPMGVKIGKDKRVFIACANGFRLEVYGLAGYTTMVVDPKSLSFEAEEGTNPVPQNISIINDGEGILNWTASADGSWISVSPAAGSTEPFSSSGLSIGADIKGLKAGTYTGSVTIVAESGATDIIAVSLKVVTPPKILTVKPSALSFKIQKDGINAPKIITIENTGTGDMSWSGETDQQWLAINTSSGTAPSTVLVSVDPASLDAGTYKGSVTVTASGAQGSPASVNVSLTVINAGTVKVKTNLADAGFDITGPANYSGTGTEWSNDEVAPGDYTINFKHITGYIRPAAQAFKVQTGKEIVIEGQYRTKQIATHIVAGSGGAQSKAVTVLTLSGAAVSTFEPFISEGSIKVQTGDIDGSGLDKIIVTDNKNAIKVYTIEGKELAAIELPSWYKNTELAVADIDNDGIAEIIAGSENDQGREIKILKYADNKLTEAGVLYTEANNKGFKIAAGDINGDGKPEIIIADENNVRAFAIDTGSKLTQLWAVNRQYENNVEIAAGDINDDGIAEIAVTQSIVGAKAGKGKYKEIGLVKILKGTGEDYGITINAYGDLGYEMPSRVAFGDIDGDGSDEIITGAGDDAHNEALIRTFETNGAFTGLTIKASESNFGVNVSLGRFE